MELSSFLATVPPPKVRRRSLRTPEVEEEIVAMAELGYPLSSIGGRLGIPQSTISGWTRRTDDFAGRLRNAIALAGC